MEVKNVTMSEEKAKKSKKLLSQELRVQVAATILAALITKGDNWRSDDIMINYASSLSDKLLKKIEG